MFFEKNNILHQYSTFENHIPRGQILSKFWNFCFFYKKWPYFSAFCSVVCKYCKNAIPYRWRSQLQFGMFTAFVRQKFRSVHQLTLRWAKMDSFLPTFWGQKTKVKKSQFFKFSKFSHFSKMFRIPLNPIKHI